MPLIVALTLMLVASIVGIALAQSHNHDDANSGRTNSADSTFALQMMQAMDRMDSGMMAAKLTDDPDRDFAAMMIPHHQGARQLNINIGANERRKLMHDACMVR